jgi:hypothetical protein
MSDKQNAGHALHRQTEAARILLANFRDVLGDDEQAIADTVEGETDLVEAIQRGVTRLSEVEAMVTGLNSRMEKLKARCDRLSKQAEHLRTSIQTAMEVSGRKTVETELATLSRSRTPPKVVVTKEEDIPAAYWVRGEPKLDKKALLAALKALSQDEKIPGAELSNGGETLTISWS